MRDARGGNYRFGYDVEHMGGILSSQDVECTGERIQIGVR